MTVAWKIGVDKSPWGIDQKLYCPPPGSQCVTNRFKQHLYSTNNMEPLYRQNHIVYRPYLHLFNVFTANGLRIVK